MKVPIEFKENIMSELGNLDIEGTWKLRGNINVLKNYLLNHGVRNTSEVFKNVESLLEISNDLYLFLTNIKGNTTAADFNKMARLFNTGGDASSAIEEILSKEDINITDMVMSGLSIVLTYVGNTSYISSALENCETTVAANSITIYDRLWSLIHKYNDNPSPGELKSINDMMNTFFNLLPNKDIPLTERILVITRMYQLLCMIYTAGIIRNITWVQVQDKDQDRAQEA